MALDYFANFNPILGVNQYLIVQSQQWKHQNNVWNLSRVLNKDTRIINC